MVLDFDKSDLVVSANGDVEIGALIAQAMEKVGREGVITCETGKSTENEIVVVEGMKFNQGFLSPLLAGRAGAKECVSFILAKKLTL